MNFGAIGAVIGHELTHGFDDEGSQFDAEGNLRNWWTAKDREQFDKLEGCFVDEYDGFVAVDDVHVRGKLTLGENTADNGGLRIAHMALLDVLASTPEKDQGRIHARPALLLGWARSGARTDVRSRPAAGAHRTSTPTPSIASTAWSRMCRIRESLWLQAGRADGSQERRCRVW